MVLRESRGKRESGEKDVHSLTSSAFNLTKLYFPPFLTALRERRHPNRRFGGRHERKGGHDDDSMHADVRVDQKDCCSKKKAIKSFLMNGDESEMWSCGRSVAPQTRDKRRGRPETETRVRNQSPIHTQ